MPFSGVQVVRFHFGGYNPGTHTTSVKMHMGVEVLDPTAITDVSERVLPGIRADDLTWSGLFNTASQALYNANALVGTGTHVVGIYLGTVAGAAAYLGTAYLLGKPNSFNIKELIHEEATFKPAGTLISGFVQIVKMTSTAGFTGTSVDYGSLTTGTVTAFAHVFALNTGTITFDVQSALTSAGAYTSHATVIVPATTAPTGTIVSATGSINRWVRIVITETVSTGTWDIAVAAAKT